MTIRRAASEDAHPIAGLHIASWQATYAKELPPEFLATRDVSEWTAQWRSRIEHGVDVLLAEEGAEIFGFVACGPVRGPGSTEGKEWEIYALHVAPERHGRGLGSALFERAVQLGQERGAADLILWVVRTNTPARAFYERKGMEPDGGQQDHSVGQGHALQEIRYRMRLRGLAL